MALSTRRLDLVDRIEELRERLSQIESEQEELKRQLESAFSNSDSKDIEDLDRWEEFESRWENLEAEKTELSGEKNKFKETVVLWNNELDPNELRRETDDYQAEIDERYADEDSCVITVRELTFGQLQRVSDDMMEESFNVDIENEDIDGTPRQGFYQTELLNEAIEDWPPGAPSREEYGRESPVAGDYPIPVGEWLFERVDAINTTGDTEMGNSSLKEEMNFKY